MFTSRPEVHPVTVDVTARGDVTSTEVSYARAKVDHVCGYAHQPVLVAHVVLTRSQDPAIERPARAEAGLDVSGTLVRAHATATDLRGAVDLLEDKLRRKLVQHQDRVRTRHRWIGLSSEHEWRHGDLPSQQEAYFPRPPEERQVIRRKTFALAPLTLDEAAYEMDLVGHDFYLFTDRRTGKEAVVYRNGEGRFAVRGETGPGGEAGPLVERSGSAPRLTEAEAISRLELSGEPFVFFVDPQTGRGRVLYLRYDGHYGLITPAEGST